MGCVESKNKKEATVQLCRGRRRLMKQLVECRREFADAQLAYLKALKNIGVTLRQFTESEYIEPENSSPPPFLPPCFQPPPLPPSFLSPEGQGEDENWAEANTEFEEEGVGTDGCVENVHPEKREQEILELADDSSSMASCHTKDTEDRAMVNRRNKKKLTDVIRELDDYFLKAWDARRQIAVFLDTHESSTFHRQILKENKRKRYNSGKVFSVWSWNRSSKSLQFARGAIDYSDSNEPCRPGAHPVTLEKIYALEQKLCKEVKDEENLKLEHERKSLLLQKQEDDLAKTDKTRLAVENLQCDIIPLQESISKTCSSLERLKNEELYPQLVGITSGMMQMWETMYESHQDQNHICQQLDNLNNDQNTDPITDYHRQATIELETEVAFWYHSFCRLISSQREYVKNLSEWVQYAESLREDHRENCSSSSISSLCNDWQLTLGKLPHEVASDALKNLLTDVQSIVFQQVDERNRKKKLDKLKRKWRKELQSQKADTDRNPRDSIPVGDTQLSLGPKHPISVSRDKTEALKLQCENENKEHLSSVQLCRAMTLTNLQRSLPMVFRSLMVFSAACVQAFESIQKQAEPEVCHEEAFVPLN